MCPVPRDPLAVSDGRFVSDAQLRKFSIVLDSGTGTSKRGRLGGQRAAGWGLGTLQAPAGGGTSTRDGMEAEHREMRDLVFWDDPSCCLTDDCYRTSVAAWWRIRLSLKI